MHLADTLPARHAGSMTYAALDLGTTNCRLLVGTPAAEGFRVVESYSRVVRLGEGLQQSGRLSTDAMERALEALQTCADRLARRPMHGMRAIATEACRRASNSGEFVARVARQTGLRLDVISSREEATLTLESCAPLLAGGGRRALLRSSARRRSAIVPNPLSRGFGVSSKRNRFCGGGLLTLPSCATAGWPVANPSESVSPPKTRRSFG